jgi:hypothetical protein
MDWFHITMRLTVLQQQTKALTAETEAPGKTASKQGLSRNERKNRTYSR